MKKSLLILLLFIAKGLVFGSTIKYEFLGDSNLGSYFYNNLFKFMEEKEIILGSKDVILTSHARADNDFSSGWINYKFYKPAGVEVSLDINTAPNSTLRLNMKFRGDKNNTFDYVFPSRTVFNSYFLKEEEVYNTNLNKGLALKIDNVGEIVLFDPRKSGWVYISIIEDSVNWTSTSEKAYQIRLKIYHKLYLVDEVLFLKWLSTHQFQFNGAGNPIPETEFLRVIPKVNKVKKNDTTIIVPLEERVELPIIEPSYLPVKRFLPNGYFIKIGKGTTDWIYLSYDPTLDTKIKALYKMKAVNYDEKVIEWITKGGAPIDLKNCFSEIRLEGDKIFFGKYIPQNCPVDLFTLKNIENKNKSFSIFVQYKKDKEGWLLFSFGGSVFKIYFDDKNSNKGPWKEVTDCFKDILITPQKIVVIGKKELPLSCDKNLYRDLFEKNEKLQEEISVVDDISNFQSPFSSSSINSLESVTNTTSSVTSSSIDNEGLLNALEGREISVEELDYVGKSINGEDTIVIFDKNSHSIFLLKKEKSTYKMIDISSCFSSIEIKDDKIILGNIVEGCKDKYMSFNDISSSSSSLYYSSFFSSNLISDNDYDVSYFSSSYEGVLPVAP